MVRFKKMLFLIETSHFFLGLFFFYLMVNQRTRKTKRQKRRR